MAGRFSKESLNTNDSVCDTCNKNIEGRILNAFGKNYHPEHFTCTKCKEPIKNSEFRQYEGKPYCDADYEKTFLKKCFSCKQPIKEKIVKALGVEWHEEHFVCTACHKPLAGCVFLEMDGAPYCSKDYYNKFGEKCEACGDPITERAVVALDKKWHQICFKCVRCEQPVIEDTFAVDDGNPVCTKCA